MITGSIISNAITFFIIYKLLWKRSYNKKMAKRGYFPSNKSRFLAYAVFIVLFSFAIIGPFLGYGAGWYSPLYIPIMVIVLMVVSWKVSTQMKPIEQIMDEADAYEREL